MQWLQVRINLAANLIVHGPGLCGPKTFDGIQIGQQGELQEGGYPVPEFQYH